MARLVLTTERLAAITWELFDTGRRTVSFLDFVQAYNREFDADFQRRVVDFLPEVAALIEKRMPCTLVNDYCLRNHAETPITNEAEARRCNVFNSGGKQPVGIRRALPDDLVRSACNGTFNHLGDGLKRHAIQTDANDVAHGVTTIEQHNCLKQRMREQADQLLAVTADPIQLELSSDTPEEG